ncbi:MAG: PadR family transcriptional regulator [Candidatus Bipolaricaulota bacterium]
MSTRLVILGLLRQGPLHGYEIKQTIEEHMGDWTSIAFGSIYYALQKLAEEGAIEVIATERSGGRPSRTVYAVTPAGEAEFARLLREAWLIVERPSYAVDLALFFIDAMPRREVEESLERRAANLEQTQTWVDQHRAETLESHHVPPQARAIFDHTMKHLATERSWTDELLAAVKKGEIRPGATGREPRPAKERP